MDLNDVRSLLDAPSSAALMTYRPDGSADVSPVWFRCTEEAFEVVIAEGDTKLSHLHHDPRVVLTIFETTSPFRGVKLSATADLESDPEHVREARLAISTRYLGAVQGRAFVDSRGPGVVVRLPLANAHAWDLSGSLPGSGEEPV